MKELGEAFNLAESTISGYENETRKPDIETVQKLADFFGVSTDYLLGREKAPNIIPAWATAKDKRDFKKMLEEDGELMFDGVPINENDRQRIMDVLTGLFWEAKQMNKRKKHLTQDNDHPDNDTKKWTGVVYFLP